MTITTETLRPGDSIQWNDGTTSTVTRVLVDGRQVHVALTTGQIIAMGRGQQVRITV